MTRSEHLQFCKKCVNREMEPDQGFICSITKKIADFEDTCENFEEDLAAGPIRIPDLSSTKPRINSGLF